MAEKISRSSIEKANKAETSKTLENLLNEEYGACYPVEDGFAVPIGKSPLDNALMWVVFPYPKAKTIQTHTWGKTTREYYNGYDEAKAYEIDLKEKEEKAEKKKELAKAKAERDKKAREKKKAEKENQ